MNYANAKLADELHELSGWDGDFSTLSDLKWHYSLGYLLRKLPYKVRDEYQFNQYGPTLHRANNGYFMYYGITGTDSECYLVNADTPENAAAKLAIELFKQGVLTKGEI